ncbi:uncharacterized protein SEPMUDRAFT_119303 [Sphaerulina musiva SO2202]|uniref:Uncharacterized protein n=1 Tax=Sphaerulina musiva (strain SO2202) TaxID=692275 RepID=N1QG56_SPHMS|nr:uncharacterized protein SEPMUDRAFT_119303 [Sphaerulina musiva SO2202]EMF10777.1 hypothetical protein SEPMUDRAFT_119303 [Sphaerulina musiva SO2202]
MRQCETRDCVQFYVGIRVDLLGNRSIQPDQYGSSGADNASDSAMNSEDSSDDKWFRCNEMFTGHEQPTVREMHVYNDKDKMLQSQP